MSLGRGLKPLFCWRAFGTPEGVPLQSKSYGGVKVTASQNEEERC